MGVAGALHHSMLGTVLLLCLETLLSCLCETMAQLQESLLDPAAGDGGVVEVCLTAFCLLSREDPRCGGQECLPTATVTAGQLGGWQLGQGQYWTPGQILGRSCC